MKKTMFSIALAITALGHAAQVQAQVPTSASPIQLFVGFGATFGGDKLASVSWTHGDDYDLRAGAVVAFTAGVEYAVTPDFALQANVGYHFDQANATNGKIAFRRYPIELLGYYSVSPQWRLGGGARYASNAKLSSSGAADIGDYEFDNNVGAVLEAEYKAVPNLGFKLRYVAETYEIKGTHRDVDGNHVGLFMNYYF